MILKLIRQLFFTIDLNVGLPVLSDSISDIHWVDNPERDETSFWVILWALRKFPNSILVRRWESYEICFREKTI